MPNQSPSLSELEKRMCPGAWSQGGFLGAGESLLVVCEQDRLALQAVRVTFSQVADALERVLQRALEQQQELHARRQAGFTGDQGKLKTALQPAQKTTPEADEFARRDVRLPQLSAGHSPGFSLEHPPDPDAGYWVAGKWQVFFEMYLGLQECPWDCPPDPWASFDFLIFHRPTGAFITGPGMIVHLIRMHQFFEGCGSPYRLDPVRAVRVLELIPGNSTG